MSDDQDRTIIAFSAPARSPAPLRGDVGEALVDAALPALSLAARAAIDSRARADLAGRRAALIDASGDVPGLKTDVADQARALIRLTIDAALGTARSAPGDAVIAAIAPGGLLRTSALGPLAVACRAAGLDAAISPAPPAPAPSLYGDRMSQPRPAAMPAGANRRFWWIGAAVVMVLAGAFAVSILRASDREVSAAIAAVAVDAGVR